MPYIPTHTRTYANQIQYTYINIDLKKPNTVYAHKPTQNNTQTNNKQTNTQTHTQKHTRTQA